MADGPHRWRDIRVLHSVGWRHHGPGTPQPRHGGTITTTRANGSTWVTETLSARQQISSAVRQAGHVTLSKSVSDAAVAGRLTSQATRIATAQALRVGKTQLTRLEHGGDLEVDSQISTAGRTAARSTAKTTRKTTAKAGRYALTKLGLKNPTQNQKKRSLTGGARKTGAGVMNQVRTSSRIISEGGQLDVDRATARTTQQAWQKAAGITGRGTSHIARGSTRALRGGTRLATRFMTRQARRTAQRAAAKAATHGLNRGLAIVRVIGALVGTVGAMIPVLALIVGIVALLCAILPSFITGVGAEQQRRAAAVPGACATGDAPHQGVTPEQVAEFLPSPQGQDRSGSLSSEQVANATAIVDEGIKVGAPPRGWAIALMTALQESDLGADPTAQYPDVNHDVGVFQQRALVGWYADGRTEDENIKILNDVHYAAATFYTGHDLLAEVVIGNPYGSAGDPGYHIPGMLNVKDWQSMDLGAVAQEVQGSAYPKAYSKHEATVAALLPKLAVNCIAGGTPGGNGLAGVDDFAPWWNSLPEIVKEQHYDPNGFAARQCTAYAAFAVRHYSNYTDFKNLWRGAHFGNAKEWHLAAKQLGIRVDGTPAIGAVAQRTSGPDGHVAYVVAVNADGSFVINEYNHIVRRGFSSRTAHIGTDSHDFNNFIHFEE